MKWYQPPESLTANRCILLAFEPRHLKKKKIRFLSNNTALSGSYCNEELMQIGLWKSYRSELLLEALYANAKLTMKNRVSVRFVHAFCLHWSFELQQKSADLLVAFRCDELSFGFDDLSTNWKQYFRHNIWVFCLLFNFFLNFCARSIYTKFFNCNKNLSETVDLPKPIPTDITTALTSWFKRVMYWPVITLKFIDMSLYFNIFCRYIG